MQNLQDLEGEIWKEIIGYEGYYQVSNLGRIKSLKRTAINSANKAIMPIKERMLKFAYSQDGYRRVLLSINKVKKMYSVSRLVAQAFIPNTENKPQVNHINGIRDDNRVLNLEWMTNKENIRHSIDVLGKVIKTENLKHGFGREHCRAKKVYQFTMSGEFIRSYEAVIEACRINGFERSTIGNAVRGKYKFSNGYRWSYTDKPNPL